MLLACKTFVSTRVLCDLEDSTSYFSRHVALGAKYLFDVIKNSFGWSIAVRCCWDTYVEPLLWHWNSNMTVMLITTTVSYIQMRLEVKQIYTSKIYIINQITSCLKSNRQPFILCFSEAAGSAYRNDVAINSAMVWRHTRGTHHMWLIQGIS